VNNGQIFALGIPLTVGMTPIEIGGGWRSTVDRRGRYAAYAGAGVVFLNYSETTPSGTTDDNTSKTFTGYSVFGGFDRTFGKHWVAGAEAQYRGIPNAIGTAGVSQIYNETSLGGFVVRALLGFKR
jgi:opacity protein-like surface antigen